MKPMQKFFGRTVYADWPGLGESMGEADGWNDVSNRLASSRSLASNGRSLDDWFLLVTRSTGCWAHAQGCIATAHASYGHYENRLGRLYEIEYTLERQDDMCL